MISQIKPEPGDSCSLNSNNSLYCIQKNILIWDFKICSQNKQHKRGGDTTLIGDNRSLTTLTNAFLNTVMRLKSRLKLFMNLVPVQVTSLLIPGIHSFHQTLSACGLAQGGKKVRCIVHIEM